MVYNKTDRVLEKQELRRKRIIKAAKEILSEEEEIGKVSIKSIARRAGIATGTFYLYFTDKESLVDMIVKEIYAELLAKIKQERAQYTDTFAKLQASMEVCIRLFLKEKYLAKILLEQFPQIHTALNTKYADIEEDLIRLTKIDLDELMAAGLIPRQDTNVTATAFVGTFREVILAWIGKGEPKDIDLAYKTLIDYNMRGIGRYKIDEEG
ncbi:TetR/AcrR family transcriptional regulator [Desulfitobacterium chlororespirans]|uniref:Transcriptional regulator, TetR family n=1 Tax=Desulfitobacterium chlororespirans DSM 11544 TaxID=1121395 RepID=A0A1M7ULI3_9FIRM|nr:TetR/AcrR family transcriptional regulator [Desulfitobacterium chlororespirans]SHN83892.1 transcriptional regulator, TetR family [Desulfitobacterium chlororespirans DSM 11544]